MIGGSTTPFQEKQGRVVAGDPAAFLHQCAGEKTHRLLHRLVGVTDPLDEISQTCLTGLRAASPVLLDHAVGEEQHPVTSLERSLVIDDIDAGTQYDRRSWPALRLRLETEFSSRTRAASEELFAGVDGCVMPVLSMSEAPKHPHNVARGTFVTRDGVVQPAPAPRFSTTPARLDLPPPAVGEHTDAVLADLGLSGEEVARLHEARVVGSSTTKSAERPNQTADPRSISRQHRQ